MKKTNTAKRKPAASEDLLPEYRFDYTKAKPNRFAKSFKAGGRLVLLEPDVAKVFPNGRSVNLVLRRLIRKMRTKK